MEPSVAQKQSVSDNRGPELRFRSTSGQFRAGTLRHAAIQPERGRGLPTRGFFYAMEMHQVRYFLAVARTLNFTRAAEECNVAQPSLTRAIRQLEEELGGDLFRRERPHAIMTELGERMHPLLKQCHDSALGARSLASSIKSGEVGALRLALSRSIDLSLFIPHLNELRQHFSQLELKFVRGTGPEVAEILKKGQADLAIAASMGDAWDRLDSWPLFTESFVLLVNSAHRLARHADVSFDDLREERLLVRTYCEHAD